MCYLKNWVSNYWNIECFRKFVKKWSNLTKEYRIGQLSNIQENQNRKDKQNNRETFNMARRNIEKIEQEDLENEEQDVKFLQAGIWKKGFQYLPVWTFKIILKFRK